MSDDDQTALRVVMAMEKAIISLCEMVIAENPAPGENPYHITTTALSMALTKLMLKYLHQSGGKAPTVGQLAAMLREMPWQAHAAGVLAQVCDNCREGKEHVHS